MLGTILSPATKQLMFLSAVEKEEAKSLLMKEISDITKTDQAVVSLRKEQDTEDQEKTDSTAADVPALPSLNVRVNPSSRCHQEKDQIGS